MFAVHIHNICTVENERVTRSHGIWLIRSANQCANAAQQQKEYFIKRIQKKTTKTKRVPFLFVVHFALSFLAAGIAYLSAFFLCSLNERIDNGDFVLC